MTHTKATVCWTVLRRSYSSSIPERALIATFGTLAAPDLEDLEHQVDLSRLGPDVKAQGVKQNMSMQ